MSTEPAEALRAAEVHPRTFAARAEPFDTYWQGTRDLRKGFRDFEIYYRANYLKRIPADRNTSILVLSCGPGYLVNALVRARYTRVLGIDSDPAKIAHAVERGLPCRAEAAFDHLAAHPGEYDLIIPEQELNHLTIDETIEFLKLCYTALKPGGQVLVYAINGTNPIVAPEHISHNIDHFYNVTDYSLKQLLQLGGFERIEPFACKLYVFWDRPLNYVGWAITNTLELVMRGLFRLYKNPVRIMSKRIAAVAFRPESS
jgi:2-polyprenyl-3-methyl-5-hydroxy-6-metoxy-1,4-benzoquinol methylase